MNNKIKILLLEDSDEDVNDFLSIFPNINFEVAEIARNAKQAIEYYNSKDFDIVLIDIFINGEPDGIYFANQINNFVKQKPFIFLTRSIEKSVFDKAKLTRPYNYLIKPYNAMELQFAIELAIEKFALNKGALVQKKPLYISESFYIKEKESLIKISINDIEYVEVNGQYCELMTSKTKHVLHSSLNNLKNKFPENQFLQTHRNFIVNAKKIKAVYLNDNLIVLNGGKKITLSRRYKTNFINSNTIYN